MSRNNPDYFKFSLSKTDRVTANGGNQIDPKTGKLKKHPKNYKAKATNRAKMKVKKLQKKHMAKQ